MKISERVEWFILIFLALVSAIVAILDFSGFLGEFKWLSDRIPTLTLLIVAVIAGYLSLERRSKLDQIQQETKQLSDQVSEVENRLSRVDAFFEMLLTDDPYEELGLLYSLRKFARYGSEKTITIDNNSVLRFWRDAMSVSNHWVTSSYIDPKTAWIGGWGNVVAQAIQQERIATGAQIIRVYIIDTDPEYDLLKTVMESQKGIGVLVKYIKKSDLLKNKTVEKYVKELGTLDMTITDNAWAFRVNLDRNRRFQSYNATKDRDIVEKVRFVLNQALDSGIDP